MTQRLDYFAAAPQGYKALGGVKSYVQGCGLSPQLIDLVYLRVSQINGCAYCINQHSRDLLKLGVSADKVQLVPVWREAESLFETRERAALAWAERVTLVHQTAIPDADYQAVAAVFGEKELADLTLAIGLMNALNRVGVGFRLVPPGVREHEEVARGQ
ncbi:carboxymuconolactone decarboxylase family protein [Pseudomonas vanderleydeniana]|uniref:Carboxymuconolactone decarboxylase family protein n=1 Tax=Pseudomonas vanderleydeniana TaxID=2745495 RepID=A0A9E6TT53_9PSED|nr:carboxymuconolactone decarboxylase family protein [Pseudomonas vanderleydeniana]QXI28860.1 carboxymuconolactone decarboxylase family protein [Pseudomonas vanderleydeniana]